MMILHKPSDYNGFWGQTLKCALDLSKCFTGIYFAIRITTSFERGGCTV